MIAVIVEHAEFRVLPGRGAELEAAFARISDLLLGAQGCHGAELLHSVDHEDTYLLRVWWENLEDHTEVFARTEAGMSLAAVLGPYCDGPPHVVHYGGSAHA
ncbi:MULTISPECIES: antibiotic biosynthesis monooxygenase family protein [Prauserella salsuginis group]|uniref:Antibiotic biosynthesis monooxygenase family protein n=1 Tax=Prauserella salsuginis TaxID=387889 RepID=A0ABW6G0U2_9PSEU|nr:MULTISPECIES: antibiotic biosynthesis monooxygenase family protein [Prauserella salsuginis group]MCR3721984.1 Heme-degrading monooxygenase HmoA [Prauserella flava]MCR3735990.1 Heme-degrading monooxygenase HmoA [Prauserella salsuginis]